LTYLHKRHNAKSTLALTGMPDLCHNGIMTLHEWMRAKGLTDAEMAAKLGVLQASTVSRYRTGHRFPEPRILKKIEDVTDRQVTASDFLEGAVAKADEKINAA
jgi:transcriptional regulator with XRE-family HTH domain